MALRRDSSETAEDTTLISIASPANESEPRAIAPAASAARVSWTSEDPSLLLEILQSHGFSEPAIGRLVQCAAAPQHTKNPLDRLAIALGASFNFLTIGETLQRPLALFGLPGAGKSTMAAKLAARHDDHELLVVSVGETPADKTAQLAEWLDVLDLPLAIARDTRSLRQVIATAGERKVVLDLSLPTLDQKALGVLREVLATSEAEGALVLSAASSKEEAAAATEAAASAGVRRVFLSQIDTTRYLGAVLEAIDDSKLALVGASVTANFGFGLRPLTPENLARRLISAAAHPERWRIAPL